MSFKTAPCNRQNCSYTNETCYFAHSIIDWIVPEALVCLNKMDCFYRMDSCYRIHDESLEEKIRLAEYKKINFKEDYRKLHKKLNSEKKQIPVEKPLLMGRPVEIQKPVIEEEKQPINPNDELKQYLIRCKAEIMREEEILKNKKKAFRELASEIWDVGSKELEFEY